MTEPAIWGAVSCLKGIFSTNSYQRTQAIIHQSHHLLSSHHPKILLVAGARAGRSASVIEEVASSSLFILARESGTRIVAVGRHHFPYDTSTYFHLVRSCLQKPAAANISIIDIRHDKAITEQFPASKVAS